MVLVGDGAFQMTGTEMATAVRYGQAPIVLILNNHGYSTEREIPEGAFNNIHEWRYEKVCELIGDETGVRIRTHGEFVESLNRALRDPSTLYVLNILLDPADRSVGMRRLVERLAMRLAARRES